MTGSNPGSATATRNVPAANAGHVDRRFGDKHSQRVGELVNRLRERRGDGLSGTLSGVLAERNSLLASELSPRGRAVLDRYDDLLIRALSQRYDTARPSRKRDEFRDRRDRRRRSHLVCQSGARTHGFRRRRGTISHRCSGRVRMPSGER